MYKRLEHPHLLDMTTRYNNPHKLYHHCNILYSLLNMLLLEFLMLLDVLLLDLLLDLLDLLLLVFLLLDLLLDLLDLLLLDLLLEHLFLLDLKRQGTTKKTEKRAHRILIVSFSFC